MIKFGSACSRLMVLLGIALILCANASLAAQQRLVLSKKADFSTNDRTFSRDDTLFMQVVAPAIDYTDVDENEFRLKPDSGGDDVEGRFTNLLNGTYEASLDLSSLSTQVSQWEWRGEIRDDSGRRFEARVEIMVGARDSGEDDVEVRGAIDALGADFVVVNGATFTVNAQTQILNRQNQIISLIDLTVGVLVEVKAVRQDGGGLLATRIKIEDPTGNEVELKGEIDSIGESNIVVLGKTFVVGAATEILDDDNEPISLADLTVGQLVEVKARRQQDGSLLATRIRLEDEDDNEVEITGIIDSIVDSTIVVDGNTFVVVSTTAILDTDNAPIALSDLSAGELVEVKGVVRNDGTLQATRIKREDRGFGDDDLELTAVVTEVGDTFIVAAGFTFQVNDQTVVLDDRNRAILLSDIKVGFLVEVRADVQSDGSLVATRIKIEDFFDDEVELTGEIESIGDSSLVVAGRDFVVTDSTQILDDNKNPITFADLGIGQLVEIRADVLVGGATVATRIKVEDIFDDEVELTGEIENLGSDSLVVSGITFFVDANTQVLDNDENPISFTSLVVGQIVEVKGTRQTAAGNLLAVRIKLEDRIEDEVEVKGNIEALTESAITVLGQTFNVTENTLVFDANQQIISLADLAVGVQVEVRGDLLPDGTLIAIRIQIEDDDMAEVEVKGIIDALTESSIQVLGITFEVTEATEILDRQNNPIAFGDLRVSQTVEIKGNRQADNSLLAVRIKREAILLLSGQVDEVVSNGIRVIGAEILLDASTLIVGKLNRTLSIEDLSAGQFVKVRAQKSNSTGFFATKVKVQDSGTITDVPADAADSSSPETFSLLQNYPNPFNPTTTIRFEIQNTSASLTPARLTIFNLLGQKVRVLVNEPLTTGVHQVQWDGRDENGVPVPSGVYLYQLRAEQITQTQRMLLLK